MDPVQEAKYELLHNKHYAEAVFTSFCCATQNLPK